jgi:hypothetical protein
MFVPEPRPIALGVAAWLALAGWKIMVAPVAFALAHMRGGEPPFEMSPTASTVALALGYLAFVVPGYVAARAAGARAARRHAAALGVVIVVLSNPSSSAALRAGRQRPLRQRRVLVDAALMVVSTMVGGRDRVLAHALARGCRAGVRACCRCARGDPPARRGRARPVRAAGRGVPVVSRPNVRRAL